MTMLSLRDVRTTLPDQISVVIPAHNEELLLGRCISSVIEAGVCPGHIYVVNDGSTDGTADIARRFAGVNLLTSTTPRGKSGALRAAIAHFELATRYQYMALLDADSRVAPTYFTEVLTRLLRDPDAVLVCGAPY